MLYPMLALVLFTYVFMATLLIWRVRSVMNGSVKASYYKLMQGSADIPQHLLAGGKHFANLFEVPVLFYAVSILIVVVQIESTLFITLGWLFVAARLIHALIHITYNNILHRLSAFWFGALVVLLMWVLLILERA